MVSAMGLALKYRGICVGLLGGLMAASAPALSYRDWTAAPAPEAAPISLLLEPVSNGCVEATRRVSPARRGHGRTAQDDYEIPARPSGGYLGQLVIQPRAGARLEWPLTVSLSFPGVEVEDLFPPAGQGRANSTNRANLKWHQPMGLLNPDSPVRPERFRRSWSIARLAQDERAALPLILPPGPCSSGANLYACLGEVRDARGTILLRKQAVELFHPGDGYDRRGTAWVMDEPEADRYLRESAGINRSSTIRELPPFMEPYAEIAALWVSADAARSATLTPAMVRRLLLMGTWIFGRDTTISNLTALAGLSGTGCVLLGGIEGVTLPLVPKSEEQHLPRHNDEDTLWDSPVYMRNTNEVPVMENRRDLFQPLQGRFLGWTLGALGIFFTLACIGLPVAFWRLKGSRRLALWWLIPAITLAISGVSLLGGRLLLPRRPQADITEYRFAFAGWPEVFCRSVNRSLTFEERRVAWTLPADSFIFPAARYGRSDSSGPEWIVESAGGVERGMDGVKRGQSVIDETAGFRSLPLPMAIAAGTNRQPGLTALAPLRQVHVWENGAWRRVGDMRSGQVALAPFGGRTNTLFGLPRRIADCFPAYDIPTGPCPHCGKVHAVATNLTMAFSNTWVVAALAAEPAAAQPAMENTRTESRVVWFIQIPGPLKVPAPGVDGGQPP